METGGERSSQAPHKKLQTEILDWVEGVETPPQATGWFHNFLGTTRHIFVLESAAYDWLLSKAQQYAQLNFYESDALSRIGTRIRNKLQVQPPLRRMSTRGPPASVSMTFYLDWSPIYLKIMLMHDLGITTSFAEVLPKILCLTGSLDQAQAVTIEDYMDQTWPQTGRAVITLLQSFVSLRVGESISCNSPC